MGAMNRVQQAVQFPVIHIRQNGSPQDTTGVPRLTNNAIHIWTAHYCDISRSFPVFLDFLSQPERDRSTSFRKPADARRSVLSHGMVRSVLARYTRSEPGMIPLVYGRNGKPSLAFTGMDGASRNISFNLSHTREMIGIGIMKDFEIGIDIVRIDPRCPVREIAGYLFTPRETKFLQGLGSDQRKNMFFTLWAMKEAVIKATGEGLGGIQEIDVLDRIRFPPSDISPGKKTGTQPEDFFICPFIPDAGYRGAVAVPLNRGLRPNDENSLFENDK